MPADVSKSPHEFHRNTCIQLTTRTISRVTHIPWDRSDYYDKLIGTRSNLASHAASRYSILRHAPFVPQCAPGSLT